MYKILTILLFATTFAQEPYTVADYEKIFIEKIQMINTYNNLSIKDKYTDTIQKDFIETSKILLSKYAEIRQYLKLDVWDKKI